MYDVRRTMYDLNYSARRAEGAKENFIGALVNVAVDPKINHGRSGRKAAKPRHHDRSGGERRACLRGVIRGVTENGCVAEATALWRNQSYGGRK